MGLRQLDQSIEREWVAGITTISFRARYLSLLPWVLAEYYESKLSKTGQAELNWDDLYMVLARLEFTTLAATRLGHNWGESGNTYGMIGSSTHAEALTELEQAGQIELPSSKQGGALGTYIMPCRTFGLLNTRSDGFIEITPRGREISQARNLHLDSGNLASLILSGGVIKLDDIMEDGQYFSMNGIDSIPKERDLLEEACLSPYSESEDVERTYGRFKNTIKWCLDVLDKANSIGSSEIISRNYRDSSENPLESGHVELAWFDYEIHRRVHFSLELLLSAVTETLIPLDGSNIPSIIRHWELENELSSALVNLLGVDEVNFGDNLSELINSTPDGLHYETPIKRVDARNMTPFNKVVYALSISIACYKQSRVIRNDALIANRPHYLEKVFEIFDKNTDRSIHDVLVDLLVNVVIESHLSTTLLKMERGAKCSLRFYPEGAELNPTGKAVAAGFSGDRLGNVIGILSDIGICQREGNSKYTITERGQHLRESLGQST